MILDVKWSPVKVKEDGSLDRKYLKISYPESSFMEYPREWEERMMFWDDIMKRAQAMKMILLDFYPSFNISSISFPNFQ